MASIRVHYTRSNPDLEPVVIVDIPDRVLKKNKKLESLGNKNSLIKENSLPNKLSSLQDIEFDLAFEKSLFKTKSKSDISNSIIDPDFISFIETKKEILSLDLDEKVLQPYDKLDALVATLIKEIDETYFQHSFELTALSAYTPKPSTSHLESVNSNLCSIPHMLFPLHLIPFNPSSVSFLFNLEFYFHSKVL